jgi:nickel-dependent lactate racemase
VTHLELPQSTNARLGVTIPTAWFGTMVSPPALAPAPDVPGLIAAALAQPLGCPPLTNIVSPGQTIAIIIDDYTRKTPARLLLPPILQQLHAAGIGEADISLVFALGTHRPMTGAEISAKVGAEIAARYPLVNRPATDSEAMVYLGEASQGLPAWVNRTVAEADVRIGLGLITPHMEAGFSGGAKIILPGVCSAATVTAFHTASAYIPANQLGRVDAPLRRHLEQFVAAHVPLDFIVNVIPTLTGEVYQCVAGHPLAAHRIGVDYAQKAFGAPVRRRYPVVVANCYPYDFDLWQSAKGVWAGDLLTADGGTLIMVTAAPEGNSSYPLLPGYIGRPPAEVIAEIESGAAAEALQAATGVMYRRLLERINLALVSPGLTPADAHSMGVPYFASVEAAVKAAVLALPPAARPGCVAVLSHGGVVLPVVEEEGGEPLNPHAGI